jgi:hypothetical protein
MPRQPTIAHERRGVGDDCVRRMVCGRWSDCHARSSDPRMLFFMDESGAHVAMSRSDDWGQWRGARGAAPKPYENLELIGAIRQDAGDAVLEVARAPRRIDSESPSELMPRRSTAASTDGCRPRNQNLKKTGWSSSRPFSLYRDCPCFVPYSSSPALSGCLVGDVLISGGSGDHVLSRLLQRVALVVLDRDVVAVEHRPCTMHEIDGSRAMASLRAAYCRPVQRS